jgi:hypothetical protein
VLAAVRHDVVRRREEPHPADAESRLLEHLPLRARFERLPELEVSAGESPCAYAVGKGYIGGVFFFRDCLVVWVGVFNSPAPWLPRLWPMMNSPPSFITNTPTPTLGYVEVWRELEGGLGWMCVMTTPPSW